MSTQTNTPAQIEFLPPIEFVCDTFAGVSWRISCRCPASEGWEDPLRADDPSKGRIGLTSWRIVSKKTGRSCPNRPLTAEQMAEGVVEECLLFYYEPFGFRTTREQVLTTDNVVVAVDVLRTRHAHGQKVYRCDKPLARQVGFVHFEEPGIASVAYIPLTVIKRVALGTDFMAWRDSLPGFEPSTT